MKLFQNGSSRISRCSSRLDPEQAIETRRPRRKSLDLLSIDDDLDLNIPLDSDIENTEPCYCFPLSLDTSCDILCDPRTFQVHKNSLIYVTLYDQRLSPLQKPILLQTFFVRCNFFLCLLAMQFFYVYVYRLSYWCLFNNRYPFDENLKTSIL